MTNDTVDCLINVIFLSILTKKEKYLVTLHVIFHVEPTSCAV